MTRQDDVVERTHFRALQFDKAARQSLESAKAEVTKYEAELKELEQQMSSEENRGGGIVCIAVTHRNAFCNKCHGHQ